MNIFNFYCDESCHLENDNSLEGKNKKVMVLSGIQIPFEKRAEIFKRIKEIKVKNGIRAGQELKWKKISPANKHIYLEIIDYFFDDDDIVFR